MSIELLQQIDQVPVGLLNAEPEQVYKFLPEPTLLHLQGKQPEPLFISVLQHGNENTGWYAVQKLLKKYSTHSLPRSLSIFFGNTQAARYGVRVLEGQPDYNRVWPGTTLEECPETRLMQAVVNAMRDRKVFASIDVHNNTGLNPHYACINKLESPFLQLAALFSHTVVYFLTPKGVQSQAFSELCPAVTIECGKTDSTAGTEHAFDYIDTVLHMQELPHKPVTPQDVKLFHTVARVKIPEEVSFSFSDRKADIVLNENLDRLNFSEIPPGTSFGQVVNSPNTRLLAFNDDYEEVGDEYFYTNGNEIKTKKKVMPSMLTLSEPIIRQDCLCYLMEQLATESVE